MNKATNNIIFVTGGCGFIGSALVRYLLDHTQHEVVNLDKLTYAADPLALKAYVSHPRYSFYQGDINDSELLESIFDTFQPNWVIHLAAESHVDTSIYHSAEFIQTNIVGTYSLLQATLGYWYGLKGFDKKHFRFLHISTDEVFGDLQPWDAVFNEESPYKPSSPYSASKASSDHLVRAWHRTYGLPILITNCSNNYGPFQHSEKLLPKMMSRAMNSESLPIYGSGLQVRDWLHVEDHVTALLTVLTKGQVGETYCIGGECEKTNLSVVQLICNTLDILNPTNAPHSKLITNVADRQGHDQRYAIDASKIKHLGWKPKKQFDIEVTEITANMFDALQR